MLYDFHQSKSSASMMKRGSNLKDGLIYNKTTTTTTTVDHEQQQQTVAENIPLVARVYCNVDARCSNRKKTGLLVGRQGTF